MHIRFGRYRYSNYTYIYIIYYRYLEFGESLNIFKGHRPWHRRCSKSWRSSSPPPMLLWHHVYTTKNVWRSRLYSCQTGETSLSASIPNHHKAASTQTYTTCWNSGMWMSMVNSCEFPWIPWEPTQILLGWWDKWDMFSNDQGGFLKYRYPKHPQTMAFHIDHCQFCSTPWYPSS